MERNFIFKLLEYIQRLTILLRRRAGGGGGGGGRVSTCPRKGIAFENFDKNKKFPRNHIVTSQQDICLQLSKRQIFRESIIFA